MIVKLVVVLQHLLLFMLQAAAFRGVPGKVLVFISSYAVKTEDSFRCPRQAG